MLVLTRRIGQEIVIADNVHLTVLGIKGEKVRIGITAPPDVRVDRSEVRDRRLSAADANVHAPAETVVVATEA